MTTLLLPPIVAAGVVTDSLGREWDPLEHPRGRDGKFIRTFRMIRAFLNIGDSEPWMTGEVQAINPDGSVRVMVTKTVDPALKDPTSGQLYVGHTVDVTPDRVESINEKAKIELGPDGKPTVATKGFDKYDFSQESLYNFADRAGFEKWDADYAVEAAERYKKGNGEPFTTSDRYFLALYAKSVSGDGRERSHEDFTNLLDELGVPGDVTDDTPDGLSGLQYLGDKVNDGRSPGQNNKNTAAWLKEAPPMSEGTIREAVHKDDPKIRLAWFDDGTQGFINADGSVDKHNPNDAGESMIEASHKRQSESGDGFSPPGSTYQPSNIPGAKLGEEGKKAILDAKGSNLDADGNRINPLLDDDGKHITIHGNNDSWSDIGDNLQRSGDEYSEKEQAALDSYHVGLSSKANGGGAVWDSMNRALRDEDSLSDAEAEMYDGLASAATRTRTSEDMNLYRGMYWSQGETLPSELFDQLHEGGVVNSKAFTSASESEATASNFLSNPDDYADVPSHAVLMEIEVPKGTHAVLGDKGQHEYVLPPNTKMEVVSVSTEEGFNGAPVTVARLRVVDDTVPDSPPDAPELQPKAKKKPKPPPEPEEIADDFDVPEPEGPTDEDLQDIETDDEVFNEDFDRSGIDDVVAKLRTQSHDDAQDQADAIEAIANNYEEGNLSREEAFAQMNEVSWEVYHQGEDDENEDLKQLSIDLDAAFPDPNVQEGAEDDTIESNEGDVDGTPETSEEDSEPVTEEEVDGGGADDVEAGPAPDNTEEWGSSQEDFGEVKPSQFVDIDGEVTHDEMEALNRYKGVEYTDINGYLRAGDDATPGWLEDNPKYAKYIASLDNLMAKSKLKESTTLYRGLKRENFTPEQWDDLIEQLENGESFTDPGFLSTSRDPAVATSFAHDGEDPFGIVFELDVAQGHAAIDSKIENKLNLPDIEEEIILDRDSTFRITSFEQEANGWRVFATTTYDAPEDTDVVLPEQIDEPQDVATEADEYSDLVDTPKKFQVLDDPGASGDGYYATNDGSKLWGKYGAAGVLVRNVDDDGVERFLMVQRGTWVSTNVGKWQLPGGALNSNENDYQGTARELNEELQSPDGWLDGLGVKGEVNFQHPSGWHYNNIAADSADMFDPTVDGTETGDAKWVTREELAQLELHPALAKNLDEILGKFPEPEKKIPLEVPTEDEDSDKPDFAANFSKKELVDGIIAQIEDALGEELDSAVKSNIHGMYQENNITAVQQDAAAHYDMTPEQIKANWAGAVDDIQKSIAKLNPDYNPDGESDVTPDEPIVDVIDTADWTKVGGQGGSNLGGTYESPSGNRYYVKQGKTEDHARNEALAAALYDAAGVESAQQLLANTPWGGLGTASPEIPGAKQDLKAHLNDTDYIDKLRDGFVTDAWLANWDVAGLVFDNVVSDENGNPVRVDPGGALFYRAQGAPKGHLFGDTVSEINTLQDPNMNPQSSKIFGGMSFDEQAASAQHVINISPELIDQLVDSVGFGNGEIDPDEMKSKLKKRRQFIADLYGLDLPENGTPDIGVPDDEPEPTPDPLDPWGINAPAPKPFTFEPDVTPETFEPDAVYQIEVNQKDLASDPDTDVEQILNDHYGVEVVDSDYADPEPDVGFQGYQTLLLEGKGKNLKQVWDTTNRPDDEFYGSIVQTGPAIPDAVTTPDEEPLAPWEKELLESTSLDKGDANDGLPGPDSEDWVNMVDDDGPYRWNGSGQKLRIGDEVTGAKGLVGTIHKFQTNNKGVVVKDAAGKQYARHRATLELTNPPDDFPDVTTPEPAPDTSPNVKNYDVYDFAEVKDALDDFMFAAAEGNLKPGDKIEFGPNKLYLEYKPDGYDPDYPITLFNKDGADLNSYTYGVNTGSVGDEIQSYHESYAPPPSKPETPEQFTMPWKPGMNDQQNLNFFLHAVIAGPYPEGSRMVFPDGHTLTHIPEDGVFRYEFPDPDDNSTNFGDFYANSPNISSDVMAFRDQHKLVSADFKTPDWFDPPAGHTPYMWSDEDHTQSIITRDETGHLWRFNDSAPETWISLGADTGDDTDWTDFGWISFKDQPEGPVNKPKPAPKAPDTDLEEGKQLGDAPDLSDYNEVVAAIGGMINKQWNTGLEDGDFVKLGSRFKLYYDEDDDRVKLIANDLTEVVDYLPGDLHQQGIEDEIHNAMLDYNKKLSGNKSADLPDIPDMGNVGETNAFNEPGDAQDHVQILQNQYNAGNLNDLDSIDLGNGWGLQYHASTDTLKLWQGGVTVKQYEHENTFGNPDFPKTVLKDMGIDLDGPGAPPMYDSVAELAKVNDIPKNLPGVKKAFPGSPMTDYQATQYRNAGYALDDASKEIVDSAEWNNAVNKAIWNLNHAGPNGAAKLAQVTKWRTDTLNAAHGGVIDAPSGPSLGPGYADMPEGHFPVYKYIGGNAASQGSFIVSSPTGKLFFYAKNGSATPSILDKQDFENTPSLWGKYTPADIKKETLPDGYPEIPDGWTPAYVFTPSGSNPEIVYAIASPDGNSFKFAYKHGGLYDSTATPELLKNDSGWKPYGGTAVSVAPGVGDTSGPDLSKPHRIGKDGKPIFIGDEVIADKDGQKYIVKSFQNNDKGVNVVHPVTGSKHALHRLKLTSTNPANKATPAGNKTAPTLPNSGVKVKQVDPDPSSPWFEKDKPEAPEPPEPISDDYKVLGDDWLEKADANYKKRMLANNPNWTEKPLSQSSTYNEYLEVQKGNKATLMNLLAKGRITQEMHDEVMPKIQAHLDSIKDIQAKHLADMEQWRDDIRAWRKANGLPTIELKGMHTDGVVELDNQGAYDYFNKNYQAPGMSSEGKSAVISQKGSNISYTLRNGKEKTLDPDWMSQNASYDVLNMDKAMLEAPAVKEDFLTIRTFEKDAFINPDTGSKYLHSEQLSNLVGTIQHDWGFAETSPGSLDAGATPGYDMGDVRMQLRVPKGTRGVWSLAVTNSHSGERGFILERGIAYYIHSANYQNGTWYVEAEIIPKDVNYDEFGHFINQNPFFD